MNQILFGTIIPIIILSIIVIISLDDDLWVDDNFDQHYYMEIMTLIPFSVIVIYSVIRYRTEKEKFMLLLSAGFLISFILDVLHVYTSPDLSRAVDPYQLVCVCIQKATAARMVATLSMVFGLIAIGKPEWVTKHYKPYTIIGGLVIVGLFFAYADVITFTYTADSIIPYPYEFLAVIIFVLSLILYFHFKLYKHKDIFILGLAVFIVTQIFGHGMLSLAGEPFSTMFNMSQIIKIGSYYILCLTLILSTTILSKEKIRMKKYAAVGEVVSRISHDLRNPLSAIKISIKLLEKHGKLSLEAQEDVRIMRSGADRMSHQIEDVLASARKVSLERTNVQLTKLFSDIEKSLPEHESINVLFEPTTIEVSIDRRKMFDVLTNLVMNAIQAIGKGYVKMYAHVTNKGLEIIIEDSGEGIPDENKDKIWTQGFTTKQIGTGFGLPNAKMIVEQHCGTINFENNPTRFMIKLPKKYIINRKLNV